MKKSIAIFLAALMLACLTAPAFAAAGDSSLEHSLTVNGENSVTVQKNDIITVQYTITASTGDAYVGASTGQNEILIDTDFFELVAGSNKVDTALSSFVVTSTPKDGAKQYVYFNWTSDLYFTKDTPTAMGSFQLKVIADSGSSVVPNLNCKAQDSVSAYYGCTKEDLTVTIGGSTPVAVTGVTLAPATLSLTEGFTRDLTAEVFPDNATNKNLVWSSDNVAVASVDQSGRVTAKAAGSAIITVTTVDGDKSATCAVTVTSSGGTGSGSTGGTSGGTTITVPVIGDKDSVDVTATVEENTAEVHNVTPQELNEIGTGARVTVNLTVLTQDITKVIIPKTTFENVAASDAEGLEVKLPNGTAAFFNQETLTAIADQARGKDIHLVVERDSKAEETMTPAQKETLRDMNKPVVLDAFFVSDGVRISDFKGGKAELIAQYPTTRPIRVWYVKENGGRELIPSTYDGKVATFTVTHFSHYVIEMLDGSSYDTCPQDETCVYAKYTDADTRAWYHPGVHFCVEKGYMVGVAATSFAPGGTLTRAMVVQILYNMEGKPAVPEKSTYTDVMTGKWYADAIAWAEDNDVVRGYGNGLFGPEDYVTREQLATILMNYARFKGYDTTPSAELDSFTDAAAISKWAVPYLKWAKAVKMVSGYPDGSIRPTGNATRAEAATMIKFFCENIAGGK